MCGDLLATGWESLKTIDDMVLVDASGMEMNETSRLPDSGSKTVIEMSGMK